MTVRKADKGGFTPLNKEGYNKKCMTQLNNNQFYIKLKYDPTSIYTQELKTIIHNIEFTYLVDRVSEGGGCEAAVNVRTICGWVKLRVCGELL